MAEWKKLLVSGSSIEVNAITATGTLSIPGFNDVSASLAGALAGGDNLGNHTATQDIDLSGYSLTNVLTVSASSWISASAFVGDGSQLTGISSTLTIADTSSTTDDVDLTTDTLTFSGSEGITTTVTDNKVTIVPPQDLRTSASPSFAGLDVNGAADIAGNLVLSGGDRTITATAGSTISLEGVVFDGGIVNSITELTASNAQLDTADLNTVSISGNVTFDAGGNQTITNSAGNLTISSTAGNVTVDGVTMAGGTVSATSVSTSGNVTVGGDLVVNGTTTTLNTTNLLVEDRYILLNSGSDTRSDSGIIFGGTEGTIQSGSALVWDASYNSSEGRLAVVNTLASNASTDTTPDYYVAGVFIGTEAQASAAEAAHTGNIRVEGGEIFIYIE